MYQVSLKHFNPSFYGQSRLDSILSKYLTRLGYSLHTILFGKVNVQKAHSTDLNSSSFLFSNRSDFIIVGKTLYILKYYLCKHSAVNQSVSIWNQQNGEAN